MTVDSQDFGVSPKTRIIYAHETSYIQKPKMKSSIANRQLIEQLHNYKFPKLSSSSSPTSLSSSSSSCSSNTVSSITAEQASFRESPALQRRKSSAPSISTPKSRSRKCSHRRSAAVSGASSNESIFSSDLNTVCSSTPPSCVTTHLPTVESEPSLDASPQITPNKLNFSDGNEKQEIDLGKPPRAPLLQPTESSYPLIDLDIASMPLKPTTLGSPLHVSNELDAPVGSIEFLHHQTSDDVDLVEEDRDDPDDESISIIDFLRESMSERAMSVSTDYDPFQYIHLNKGMWIGEEGKEKK